MLKTILPTGTIVIFLLICSCKKTGPEPAYSVATDDIELYSEGIYKFAGSITGPGDVEIIGHGFYWSESENPEINGLMIQLGNRLSTGKFSSKVYEILPHRTYYVKAFAIVNSVSLYGDVKSFTTPDTIVFPIIDYDQNIYYPVVIGDQTWLSENLKATHYADGSPIPFVEDRLKWFDNSRWTRAYCWYENYGALGAQYGALYTWPAAMNIGSPEDLKPGNIQGVCPVGWHLPSDSEWKQLEMFLGMNQTEADGEKWRGVNEGGKLKYAGTDFWISPNIGSTNESGFKAMPGGWRDGAGYFSNLGLSARLWTSTKDGDFALIRQLDNNSSQIFRDSKGVYEGNSVRCIKDK